MTILASRERQFHVAQIVLRIALASAVATFGHSTFYADVNQYYKRASDISLGFLPYKDFLWEYPPLAASPLALIPALGRSHTAFFVVFVALMIAIEYTCMLLLRRARPEVKDQIARAWLVFVVPLSMIGWFRLDFLAVLCATIAVIAIAQNRRYVAALIVGFGAKLWPLVFGIAMVLQRRWKDALLAGAGCIALVGAWYAFSPEGFRAFLDYRHGNGFQVESIPGSILLLSGREVHLRFGAVVVLDHGYAWLQVVLQVVFVFVPLVAVAAAWRRKIDLIALLGALVCVMLLSNRLLSPQFLIWLAPFVVWLFPQHKRPIYLAVAAVPPTLLAIQFYEAYIDGNVVLVLLVILRNLLLVGLAADLFKIAFSQRTALDVVSNDRDQRAEQQ